MPPLEIGEKYVVSTENGWFVIRLVAFHSGFIQAIKLSDLATFDVGDQSYVTEPTIFLNIQHIVSVIKLTPKS